jgi:negative regulator of sigma E activity
MSDAKSSPKSVLTDAMEKVQAKINAETTDEQEAPTEKKYFNKKNFIRMGAAAAVATVAIVAVKLLSGPEETETSEEITTED